MWTSTPAGCLIGDNCNSDVGGEPDALKGASPVRRGAEGRSLRDATRPTLRLDGKYPAPAPIITNPETRDVELEVMFSRIDATVRIGGSQAYYHTRDDYIQMPAFEAFHSADDYYATLAHEAVHHAGHESRLNRKTLISTSRADYARDELVAELGASFIGAIVGFKVEEREDHAAYIEHWLTALRNDKRAIFEAAREAQNAADYLLAMMTDQAD